MTNNETRFCSNCVQLSFNLNIYHAKTLIHITYEAFLVKLGNWHYGDSENFPEGRKHNFSNWSVWLAKIPILLLKHTMLKQSVNFQEKRLDPDPLLMLLIGIGKIVYYTTQVVGVN